MRCSRPTYLVVVFMGVRRDDGVWLLGTACHFIGPMMLSMETLCQSMDGLLRRIQKLVDLPWRADRLWGGVDRAAFHRLGAPWAGLACTAVDRVEEETVTPVFHSTQISGGVDRAEFLDRGGEATSIFHREIVHEGEAVRLAVGTTGHINPALARILIAAGAALQGPVSDLVGSLGLLHIHRKCKLEHLLMLVPIERNAQLDVASIRV